MTTQYEIAVAFARFRAKYEMADYLTVINWSYGEFELSGIFMPFVKTDKHKEKSVNPVIVTAELSDTELEQDETFDDGEAFVYPNIICPIQIVKITVISLEV